jgi:hypothetical protein
MQSLIRVKWWKNHKMWGGKQDLTHFCIYCIPITQIRISQKKYDALMGPITSINKKKFTSIQNKTSQMKESNQLTYAKKSNQVLLEV